VNINSCYVQGVSLYVAVRKKFFASMLGVYTLIYNKGVSMQNTEIEVKVKCGGVDELIRYMDTNGSSKGETHQVDIYYNAPDRDFLKTALIKEWVRVRISDKGNSINYKNWIYDDNGVSNHCDEYETKVDDIEQLQHILKALGYTELVTVDKRRRVWDIDLYEVSVDRVESLGDYVEVEYKGELKPGQTPATIAKEMLEFLKKNGCQNITRDKNGYPYALIEQKQLQ
jgi:adenylate cyclase, class 2